MKFIKRFRFCSASFVLLCGIVGNGNSYAQNNGHGIAAANINVIQNDTLNTTNSVSVTTSLSMNQFSIRDGSNRGDVNVQIGANFSDDVNSGVIMTSVVENGRDNGETNYPGLNYCTTAIDYSRTGINAGAYYLSVFNAPAGAEFNMNIAAAFFPYTNWLGGLARNSIPTNGGPNDLFTGSPGLVLGTHFVDNGGGISTLDLTGFGINSQTDGVLLVTHGKNEDNYASSAVNTNGTWTIYIKDNGTDAGSYEQDPVAFVFIPKTNTTVISGRFRGDGTRLIFSGATPQYSITNTSSGNWLLTIPGHSPCSGVLIISAEGGLSQNQDNIVSYQPDGDGWIIQSRDLPGGSLQTPGSGLEPVASFVFIPAIMTVNMVSPSDNAQGQTSFPNLQASVSNSASDVTMKFYGRVAPANPMGDFSIALLPDTQFYADLAHGGLPAMWFAQTEWIITNRVSDNIAYVVHLGDIVDHGDNNGGTPINEWRNATNAMYRLENPTRTFLNFGIPYGTAVGNHDQSPNGDATGTTTFFNQYFGISHFTGKPYYAGHYGTNNDNHFDFFSAGGLDFVVLYFEYDSNANPTVLAWGNEVLRTNANRRAIIVTHNFGNTANPLTFSAQGAAIYNALKTNSNVFLMLAGHVTGEGARVDTFNGNTIRTYVQDFQGWTNGGNGFMRMMYFSPKNNQVVVQTFSAYTGEYLTDADSEFFFNYNMGQPSGSTNSIAFNLLGTLSNVLPGNVASLVWSNRLANTKYEWYVVATDASNNITTGPTWHFSIGPNSAPTASNQVTTIVGDTATNLTLRAFDANGDHLTFQTNSRPANGMNLNFDSYNGTVTYQPVRGFRGFDRFTYYASDNFASSSVVTFNMNIISPPDTNGNGLPDAWETLYGISDPNADADNDGLSNLKEYYANTNPTNAASLLRLSNASRAANGFVTLSWPSIGGTRYRVQYSDAETNGSFTGFFTDILRPLSIEMGSVQYNLPYTQTFVDDFTLTGGSATNRARYYRIKVTQ